MNGSSGGIHARSSLAGGLSVVSFLAFASGVFSWYCPSESVLGPLARILDPFSPMLVATGLLFACLALAAGARLVGASLALAAAIMGVLQFASYRDLTLPNLTNRSADIRVLFFNVEARDPARAERVVAAALAQDADILVFAEAGPLVPALDRLREDYEFVSECDADTCEILVATRLEVIRFWRLQLNPAWPPRYAVLEVAGPGDGTLFVAAAHLAKPWMSGIAEGEFRRLVAQFDWLTGPALAVGDFNMAPWSLPMRSLLGKTGFRAVRGQPASWPANTDPALLPLDQALLRGGVRAVGVSPFGRGLDSNHLGFVADIAVVSLTD